MSGLWVFDAEAVRTALSFEALIPAVRAAMIALSDGRVRQRLRSFIALGEGRTFAIMPAALGEREVFGAKLVSVFADGQGHRSHEGVVVLFDGETGKPICIADAGEITALRTAAASAVAVAALARPDARVLAILGAGRQAEEHIRAVARVRPIDEVRVWSRNAARSADVSATTSASTGLPVRPAASVREAVAGADIICTVTCAPDPILEGSWVEPGAHVNVVGSSNPAHAEIDVALVAGSRFFVDHLEHVLAHGGEFRRARAAGIVEDGHIVAEIGQVLSGARPGRTNAREITLYKSLGHAVQDLAAAAWLHRNAS